MNVQKGNGLSQWQLLPNSNLRVHRLAEPHMDVKFGAWTDEQEGPLSVNLKTSLAADPQSYEQVAISMGEEMDNGWKRGV